MIGDPPRVSRSITIRISLEQFEFVQRKSREGYRSMNRQFGLMIRDEMEKEKATGPALESSPVASEQ